VASWSLPSRLLGESQPRLSALVTAILRRLTRRSTGMRLVVELHFLRCKVHCFRFFVHHCARLDGSFAASGSHSVRGFACRSACPTALRGFAGVLARISADILQGLGRAR